jgi:hypothetical protein
VRCRAGPHQGCYSSEAGRGEPTVRPGFDFLQLDWFELVRLGVLAGVSYLGKNLFTTTDGKFMRLVKLS